MANLKEVRNRITSVNSTRQITSAMKMVAAAKLRRAQDSILTLRPYAQKLNGILQHLSSNAELEGAELLEERQANRVLIVAISSNRGLCGAFNNNVIKRAVLLANEQEQKGHTHFITIGKKANDQLKKRSQYGGIDGLESDHHAIYDELSFEKVSEIASSIIGSYREQRVDKVVLVYNAFKNAAVQQLTVETMLPFAKEELEETNSSSANNFLFEPNQQFIVSEVIPQALKVQLYKAVLESVASEHGARMTAMHKATDNASDLINDLKLEYNKARQAAITGELMDIVGGAEALG